MKYIPIYISGYINRLKLLRISKGQTNHTHLCKLLYCQIIIESQAPSAFTSLQIIINTHPLPLLQQRGALGYNFVHKLALSHL